MVQSSQGFPHIQLTLTHKETAKSLGGGGGSKETQTEINKNNRQGHGSKIKNIVSSVVDDWRTFKEEKEKEEQENKQATLPDAISLILEIDPETFDLDDLRTSDIAIISELEDGYIIGASADTNLSELQKKIENFINNQKGGGVIAKILNVLDKNQHPEFILSPSLLEKWDQIRDDQIYIVEVGISCLGTKTKLPEYPEQKNYKNPENYVKAINKWIEDRKLTYQEWDELASERQEDLSNFLANPKYHGEILSIVDGITPQFSRVPDSFSCLIQISGLGLKDLVFNFPYVFEVTEQENIYETVLPNHEISEYENDSFILESPDKNAPKVCIIDSGIQQEHPLLKNAIDAANSISLIPSEINLTADMVTNGGHGTRVAGAVLYPRTIPRKGIYKAVCWLQNARILDKNCRLLNKLYPPDLLERIVEYYYSQTATRIFNHSLASDAPCRTRYMSAWAYTIDQLSYEKDILFIVAAGNIPLDSYRTSPRLSVKYHLLAGREYPDYLTENSCRIANPSQSFQALTVGSITLNSFRDLSWSSLGEKDEPSPFSCSGLGIWDTVKPEVVEYGGDILKDDNQPPTLGCNSNTSPELVRSTLSPTPSPLVAADAFGTSFAAPRVTHIAARLAAEFPNESCLLYRALIVQSARWPDWALAKTNEEKYNVIRQIGYGISNLERAISNTPNRITLITQGEKFIKAGEVDIYQVKLPDSLRSPGEEFEILLEITLSYKAQPRRTRRNKRKYLSTWLDWDCSKAGEDSKHFLGRMLANHKIPEDAEKGDELFTWTLGKEKRYRSIKNVSRSIGTIQKDWAVVKSYNLREAFCIAVVGHEGWNNDPFAEVPYSLVVSFEAIQADIPIYTPMVEAQIETEIQTEIQIQSL
ncbi:S8 family peptidase [Dolichospermum heterosporum]|uniref:S8 family peptidase n=1 Tax=Dolichospermum heterosporum TAC447 TaxID=747523 RepID=A0ABY5LQX7_9CYAN|nr:S8 family peptidase [Dolichospermum heterosporum]UUO13110.1 S8 family peptidase [Dolichospermum heterosporum TAC447]